jgi:hypothetical protein
VPRRLGAAQAAVKETKCWKFWLWFESIQFGLKLLYSTDRLASVNGQNW